MEYKYFAIVGLILGMFVWYIRFLKESETDEAKPETIDPTQKIKSILKRVDSEVEESEQRKNSIKSVRFLATETAEKWSIFSFIENTKHYSIDIVRAWLSPVVYRVERQFT